MTGPEIIHAVDEALRKLRQEPRTLQWKASERSFAHRLAVHMEPLFPNWDIDCEYNKDGVETKELLDIAERFAKKPTDRILPDIIVHRRNASGHDANLLVIEMKRDEERDALDKVKLEMFTGPEGRFRYHLGLYIDIAAGRYNKTWYKNGTGTD